MGYRSEVAAVFYAADVKDFATIKLWLDENFPMKEWGENIRWFNKGMAFQADNVKWYDNMVDVQAFDEASEEFQDLFCMGKEGVPIGAYEFVRMGEEYEDIEVVRDGEHEYLIEVDRILRIEV
jgi:hypothetical protein